jgi:penicillin amidase
MSDQSLRLEPATAPPADVDAAGGHADADPPASAPIRDRRSRRRRLVRRAALWTFTVVVVLALIATGLVIWTVRRSFPHYGGALSVPGLTARVTVHRDAYGIPQIFAATAADLFKAQGYVTAQDRFWEMDVRRHITSGRLSELFGASQLATDAFLRTLGVRRVAEQEWRLISPEARAHLQAYADGVNAWIADHGGDGASATKSLEYAVLGLSNRDYRVARWDPIDSIAWLKAMAWNLAGNVDDEVNRATLLAEGLSRDQIAELYPPYPARNRPIVERGGVVGGAFDASAGAARDGSAPTSPGAVTDTAWRQAAPALAAIGATIRELPAPLAHLGDGVGSNSWVVSGALTDSGKPLLANDPHLGTSIPGIWYQVGLHCNCAYDVEGFSLSGLPGVVVGHNDRIAWGLTNLGADVTDLYLEKVDGNRYFDGAGWRSMDAREEEIRVAGGEPVTITVRSTKHGPLLSDRWRPVQVIAALPPLDPSGSPLSTVAPAATPSLDPAAPGVPPTAASASYAVSLRWTALEPGRSVEAVFALDRAGDWTQFRAAAALFEAPPQNLVYADVDGNIGYQAPGRIPVRGKGDGSWPAPGYDPAYDWRGYVPFAALPNELNPPGGMIVTANQAVTGSGYPYLLTGDWAYGYRSQRILDLLKERDAHGKLTVADMRTIQFDNRNAFASELVPALLAAPLGDQDSLARARDLLTGWDFQQPAATPARTSAAAAFYNATWRHLLLRLFDEFPPDLLPTDEHMWEVVRTLLPAPTSEWWDNKSTSDREAMDDILVGAMADAVEELTDRLGADPDDWRWGDLHTTTLANDTLGRSGIAPVEWLFNRGGVKAAGGGGIVNATSWSASDGYQVVIAPAMRMIVDMSNLDKSRWVQLSGNSGHAFHPNYADQIEAWRTGRDTAMRWSRPAIESAAKHTLTLLPADAG